MASWIVHLRIADELAYGFSFDHEKFIVGNIAPDSGEIMNDGTYQPSKEITHWKTNQNNRSIQPDDFYKEYLITCKTDNRPFYLGYFCHLITDLNWINKIIAKTKRKLGVDFAKPRLQHKVQSGWYALDMLYLRQHNNMNAFKILNNIKSFDNVYLDYFSKNAVTNKIRQICDFYNNNTVSPDRKFEYLTMDEVDEFVFNTTDIIRSRVRAFYDDSPAYSI